MSALLSTLTHAPAEAVKAFAEDLIPRLGTIHVLVNRTGLVMIPYTDSAGGVTFHLGEVLVSEAQVSIAEGVQGYALVVGRDLVQALAIALIDAAARAGIAQDVIDAFARDHAGQQAVADHDLLTQIEATRIEMETFAP